jgi:hypothetical protein
MCRRVVLALSLSIATCAAGVAPALADGFALVIPGRMGMTYFGRDAAYAVVEGEFGLNRPGQNPHTVIFPRTYVRAPSEYGYFPNTGKRPRVGRLEVEPPANRRLPPRAESFHQVWKAEPEPERYVEPPPSFYPPPVIVAPDFDRRELRRRN